MLDLKSIQRGIVELPPRIVLLGVEKIGKSTFASQFPNPIFLPVKGEEGIDALDVSRFPTITTFAEALEAIGTLYNEEHEFQTLVIDSASTLEPLIWNQVCEDNNAKSIEKAMGGFAKGYIEALGYWRTITDGLDALRQKGIGSILIGHVKVKPFNDPTSDPYDTYQFDVHDKAANLIYRWSDSILFASRKVVTKEVDGRGGKVTRGMTIGDEPKLYTQKRPAHPGGGRGLYGQLPYELPLNYDAFCEALVAARTN